MVNFKVNFELTFPEVLKYQYGDCHLNLPIKILELDFKSGRPTQRLGVFSQPMQLKGPGSSRWAAWPKNTDILPSDNTRFNIAK